jgi:hypothetical protein
MNLGSKVSFPTTLSFIKILNVFAPLSKVLFIFLTLYILVPSTLALVIPPHSIPLINATIKHSNSAASRAFSGDTNSTSSSSLHQSKFLLLAILGFFSIFSLLFFVYSLFSQIRGKKSTCYRSWIGIFLLSLSSFALSSMAQVCLFDLTYPNSYIYFSSIILTIFVIVISIWILLVSVVYSFFRNDKNTGDQVRTNRRPFISDRNLEILNGNDSITFKPPIHEKDLVSPSHITFTMPILLSYRNSLGIPIILYRTKESTKVNEIIYMDGTCEKIKTNIKGPRPIQIPKNSSFYPIGSEFIPSRGYGWNISFKGPIIVLPNNVIVDCNETSFNFPMDAELFRITDDDGEVHPFIFAIHTTTFKRGICVCLDGTITNMKIGNDIGYLRKDKASSPFFEKLKPEKLILESPRGPYILCNEGYRVYDSGTIIFDGEIFNYNDVYEEESEKSYHSDPYEIDSCQIVSDEHDSLHDDRDKIIRYPSSDSDGLN